MGDQLFYSGIIADDKPVECPFAAKDLSQQKRVRCRRDSIQVVEGGHEAADARVLRGLERNKIYLAQGTLAHVDRVVIATRLGSSVGGKMFRAGHDLVRPAEVVTLKAAYMCDRHDRAKEWVLA